MTPEPNGTNRPARTFRDSGPGRGRPRSGSSGRPGGRDPSRYQRPVSSGSAQSRNFQDGPARPPAAPSAAVAQADGAPPAPRVNPELRRQTQALALAAWDIARTRTALPDTPRGHVITLRTQQKLTAAWERERAVPEPLQSTLRVKEDGKESCLLIPGITTGPREMRELAARLFEADFNVWVLRIPPYGKPGHSIGEVSWESALNQVTQGYRLLQRGPGRVHVVGLGFGATLALLLAQKEKVGSLVLLSPAIMPKESFFQRLLVHLRFHRLGFVRRWLGLNTGMMEGMDRARSKIGQIRVPIYAAQCEDDTLASPASLRILQRKAGHTASRFQIFADGGHDILATHGEGVLFGEILKFLRG